MNVNFNKNDRASIVFITGSNEQKQYYYYIIHFFQTYNCRCAEVNKKKQFKTKHQENIIYYDVVCLALP